MNTISISALVSAIISLCILGAYLLLKDAADLALSDGTLGFLGALMGAGLAVIGALYVEKIKQEDAKANELNLLADSLETMRDLLLRARNCSDKLIDKSNLFAASASDRNKMLENHSAALSGLDETLFSEIADQVDFIAYYADKRPIGSSKVWADLQRIARAHVRAREQIVEPGRIGKLTIDEAYTEGQKVEQMFRAMATPTAHALIEINTLSKQDRNYRPLIWRTLEAVPKTPADRYAPLPRRIVYRTEPIRLRNPQ
jgi:uncharacterized MnhB-related membrane protein